MTSFDTFLVCLSAIGFSISLLVETSSWHLRSLANKNSQGLFNSRANIYLYGGRFFALAFMMLMSSFVDRHFSLISVIESIAICVTLAGVFQLSYASFRPARDYLDIFLFRVILHGINDFNIALGEHQKDSSLFLKTIFSTVILCVGVTSPYIIASKFPDARMTISTLGQIINAFGTVILLFWVEPHLYKKMDKGQLNLNLHSYFDGRALGLIIVAILLWVSYFSIALLGVTK